MKNEDVVRLFDAYADDLYRFAVYYAGSKHDAEDIVQDVFLKLLDDKVAIKHGKEKTYLFTMTANSCRDILIRLNTRHLPSGTNSSKATTVTGKSWIKLMRNKSAQV